MYSGSNARGQRQQARGSRSQPTQGPGLVELFLQELARYTSRAPGSEVSGTPHEIAEGVLMNSMQFTGCKDAAVQNLSRQLVMAVNRQGRRYGLACRQIGHNRIQVVAL